MCFVFLGWGDNLYIYIYFYTNIIDECGGLCQNWGRHKKMFIESYVCFISFSHVMIHVLLWDKDDIPKQVRLTEHVEYLPLFCQLLWLAYPPFTYFYTIHIYVSHYIYVTILTLIAFNPCLKIMLKTQHFILFLRMHDLMHHHRYILYIYMITHVFISSLYHWDPCMLYLPTNLPYKSTIQQGKYTIFMDLMGYLSIISL